MRQRAQIGDLLIRRVANPVRSETRIHRQTSDEEMCELGRRVEECKVDVRSDLRVLLWRVLGKTKLKLVQMLQRGDCCKNRVCLRRRRLNVETENERLKARRKLEDRGSIGWNACMQGAQMGQLEHKVFHGLVG